MVLSSGLKEEYAARRADINSHPLSDFEALKKSKGLNMYNCPICGSGTKRNKTGALKLYPPTMAGKPWRVICFSSWCFGLKGTDTLGAIKILHPEMTEREIFKKFCGQSMNNAPSSIQSIRSESRNVKRDIVRWEKAFPKSAAYKYLIKRGFKEEFIVNCRFGFDAYHYFPALGQNAPALIIFYPNSDYWVARSLVSKAFDKPRAAQYGNEPLFNTALNNDTIGNRNNMALFIVESQLCALSLMQLGFSAIALGNCGGSRLVEYAKSLPDSVNYILSLDNDEQSPGAPLTKGPKAQKDLKEALEKIGKRVSEYNISGEYKDPNEALQKEPDNLKERALRAIREVSTLETMSGVQVYLKQFNRQKYDIVRSGFKGLDKNLGGGFRSGLYIIGAVTSLGKTSFMLQVCDQIARRGRDVLFFSLEMGIYELIAKSISRMTYEMCKSTKRGIDQAKTANDVLLNNGTLNNDISSELINDAMRNYYNTAANIWIMSPEESSNVKKIGDRIRRHIEERKSLPVVIIDYLQILGLETSMSDKQRTDINIFELKKISGKFQIPVIAISSLNRDGYSYPVNITSYKETGAIEYGSDCLLGMQYEGMDMIDGENDKKRELRVRSLCEKNETIAKNGGAIRIQIKILKNRNGSRGGAINYLYVPKYNYFEENDESIGDLGYVQLK